MMKRLDESSPSTRARITAAFYVIVIAGGIIAQVVIADRLIAYGDAAKTVANILANTTLYRLAFTIFMIEMVAQFAMTAMFYDLLKPVNRSVARMSAIFGFAGCGIKMMARLFFYAPLIVLGGASYFSVFESAQLGALTLLLIRINDQGAAIVVVFFGFEKVLHGLLVFNSGFLPRVLGVISMIAGVGWLTYLWPPLGSRLLMFIALVAIVGVIAMVGWLFIRGVDDEKWRERAALAASSIWR